MHNSNVVSVEQEVAAILSALCSRPTEQIGMICTLVDDLYVDSIKFLELLAILEERFGFELGVDDLRPELFHTVAAVVHFVQRRIHS